jgi:hypothetical protein
MATTQKVIQNRDLSRQNNRLFAQSLPEQAHQRTTNPSIGNQGQHRAITGFGT